VPFQRIYKILRDKTLAEEVEILVGFGLIFESWILWGQTLFAMVKIFGG
jgi:hypothetical protein